VLLHLIAEKPRHGYELIKSIEDHAGGAYSPSPGVVSPTLTTLQELGYATLTEQDGRKLYALTEPGAAFLQENQPKVDAVVLRMAEARRSRRWARSADRARSGEPAAGVAATSVAWATHRGAGAGCCRGAGWRIHGGGESLTLNRAGVSLTLW